MCISSIHLIKLGCILLYFGHISNEGLKIFVQNIIVTSSHIVVTILRTSIVSDSSESLDLVGKRKANLRI